MMEANILDANGDLLGIIDSFNSFIWTKRFYECGDFELYVRSSDELLNLVRGGTYIARDDDDMVCLIETIKINTDVENGDYLTISGRCLKSILDRRVIWYQTNLIGRIEEGIRRLVDANAINPVDSVRRISGLQLGPLQGFTETAEVQFTGDNLYTTIVNLCKHYAYGFQITRNAGGNFVFNLAKGVDRSYDQTANPYVVFSPEFDNLPRSNYEYKTETYKNTALIAGEGDGVDRRRSVVGSTTGLNRRELFIDAKDISSNFGEIPNTDYTNLLRGRGNETLATHEVVENIDGEIETLNQYVFGVDYFLGDVVQVRNEYGIEAKSIVAEVIECEDETGHTVVPTFSAWQFN